MLVEFICNRGESTLYWIWNWPFFPCERAHYLPQYPIVTILIFISLQREPNTRQWNPGSKRSSKDKETSRNNNKECGDLCCEHTPTPIGHLNHQNPNSQPREVIGIHMSLENPSDYNWQWRPSHSGHQHHHSTTDHPIPEGWVRRPGTRPAEGLQICITRPSAAQGADQGKEKGRRKRAGEAHAFLYWTRPPKAGKGRHCAQTRVQKEIPFHLPTNYMPPSIKLHKGKPAGAITHHPQHLGPHPPREDNIADVNMQLLHKFHSSNPTTASLRPARCSMLRYATFSANRSLVIK